MAEVNAMDRDRFVAVFGGVFEHSPWVAERAFAAAPFASGEALHAAMSAVVDGAAAAEQEALIRAHPALAGRAAIGTLTEASAGEQRGAGLDRCTPEEYERLQALNTAYRERFGFPFVLAVRGHTRHSIIEAMEARLRNTPAEERREALRQIRRIAAFRLEAIIDAE